MKKVETKDDMEKKNCPYCGEEILATAKKCKHCGEFLEKQEGFFKKYYTMSERLRKEWLNFSGTASEEEMRCMNITLFLDIFILIIIMGLLESFIGDIGTPKDLFRKNPFPILLLCGVYLRFSIIPYISCIWRYLIVSSYKEAKEEIEKEKEKQKQ